MRVLTVSSEDAFEAGYIETKIVVIIDEIEIMIIEFTFISEGIEFKI